jgi:tetratricopeptide (TPR) repeat protein
MKGAPGFFEGLENSSRPPLVKPATLTFHAGVALFFLRVTHPAPISGFKRMPVAHSVRPVRSPAIPRPASVIHWQALLLVGVVVAYATSINAPFFFDDVSNLAENPALQPSAPIAWQAVDGDAGATLSGRPLILASFVANRALTGLNPAGFRAGNILIHAVCALLLFGLLRRLLIGPALRRHFSSDPMLAAFAISLLWALHPLQTSAVTYVIQRAESLTALCFIATVYAFMRAVESSVARPWLVASIVSCALGMTGKETMVVAPVAVLLLDATFVAGGAGAALRQRGQYYAALAATWLILLSLVMATGGRGGTAGFDSPVSVWGYLLTQCDALVRYAGLIVWPHPLVFDYGTQVIETFSDVWWQAVLVVSALAGSLWLWRRQRAAGSALFWFFLLLAPTSSFVPIASQTIAEHRLYLALLGPLALLAAAAWRWFGPKALLPLLAVAVGFGALTYLRNRDYRSELTLWGDTVEKRPANPRARINLARAYLAAGQTAEAETQLRAALRLEPGSADAHYNLGVLLGRAKQPVAAEAAYREAVRLRPAHAEAWNNLGSIRLDEGKHDEALALFQRAIDARPRYAEARANLSLALLDAGRTAEALTAARAARLADPRSAVAAFALGNASIASGLWGEAHAAYRVAVSLRSDYAAAHNNLANVLLGADRVEEALTHYRSAAQADANYVEPRRALTAICAQTGRYAEALRHGEELLRLQPGDEALRQELVRLRAFVR